MASTPVADITVSSIHLEKAPLVAVFGSTIVFNACHLKGLIQLESKSLRSSRGIYTAFRANLEQEWTCTQVHGT